MGRHRMDEGTAVGLQATALGVGLGAMLYTGHARAMENVRRQREQRQQAMYDAAVDLSLQNAADLEAYASRLAHELAETKAQNTRLRRTLAQRQAYIDRMKGDA